MPPRKSAKKTTTVEETYVFLADIHPQYRTMFLKICEINNITPIMVEDHRPESEFLPTPTTTAKKTKKSVKTKEAEATNALTAKPEINIRYWDVYPTKATKLRFSIQYCDISNNVEPLYQNTKASHEEYRRRRPPCTSSTVKSSQIDVRNIQYCYSEVDPPKYAYYQIPSDNSAINLDHYYENKYINLGQALISKEDFANLPELVSKNPIIYGFGLSSSRSFRQLPKTVKSWNKEISLFVLADWIEGINWGEMRQDVLEIEGHRYFLSQPFVYVVPDPKIESYKKAENATRTIFNDLLKRPIKDDVFKDLFVKMLTAENTEALKTSEKRIDKLQKELMEQNNLVGGLRLINKTMRKRSDEFVSGFVDQIRSIPDLAEVSLTRSGFHFKTRELYFEHENKPRYLGVFVADFILFGKQKGFSYQNVEAPNENRHTPHGTCMGSYQTKLNNCLGNLDYYSFVLTFLSMLQAFNPDDGPARSSLEKFPGATKPKKTYVVPNRIVVWGITPKEGVSNHDDDDDDL